MKKIRFILLICLITFLDGKAQHVAVKTNILYDATTTLNLGCEVGLSKHFTADVSGNYNPWTFSGGKSIQHWMIQPELRWWLREGFNGHFFGAHLFYGDMNVAGSPFLFNLKKEFSYDGLFVGAGLSYGYQLYLSPHWNIEFTVGAGYTFMDYQKKRFPDTDHNLGTYYRNYFGLTKAGISIVYIIK